MTPAYDIERVATVCGDLTRAIAAALVHDLPVWMIHRFNVMTGEASALATILRQHAPDVMNNQIHTICFDCAKALGYTLKDKAMGVWTDTCDVCKQSKPCTNLHHDWVPVKGETK